MNTRFLKILSAIIFIFNSMSVLALEREYNAYFDYADEGRFAFNARGFGYYGTIDIKDNPAINNDDAKARELKGGGLEVATAIFFTDNIATEFSFGAGTVKPIIPVELKDKVTAEGKQNLTDNMKYLYFFPARFSFQFHLAPFAAINPYIGVGAELSLIYSRIDSEKVAKYSNGGGIFVRGGININTKNNYIFNLDIKKNLYSKLHADFFKDTFGETFALDLSENYWSISLGIGYKV